MKKKVSYRGLFGKFPRKSGKTAQQLKDEARVGWDKIFLGYQRRKLGCGEKSFDNYITHN